MINKSNLTSERIAEYLASGKRFDGRKAEDFRDLEIDLNLSKKAEGSAKVKLGKTEVWAGVKMAIGSPYDDSPDKGNLMVTAELTPLSGSKYEYGPPKFHTIELGRLVDRGLRESGLIEFEKLCIEKGEKVWTVFVDVYSINDDGNLLDCAFIAALAALKSAKVPVYDEKEEKIDYDKESKEKFPLTKDVPMNFSVHKIEGSVFLDPSIDEETASEGRLVLAAIPGKPFRICSMQKSQDMEMSLKEFSDMLAIVEKQYDKFYKKVNDTIDKAIKDKK
jgi:exosome complex component RRP42